MENLTSEGDRRILKSVAAVLALVVCVWSGATAQNGLPEAERRAIDQLFAGYDRPGSPGCLLGVVRNGQLTYTRGYGRANLEHDIPFTEDTVFDLASTSKQFTATALVLLEQDGKLSLDDDVRKYVPELPDYGRRITIRHLLSHTSGLRDYIALLTLAGWQLDDVTTTGQALAMVARQNGVDFAAGEEFAYSNTGFFLPSLIVERVTGKSLGAFAAERIFGPLGMSSTLYLEDHARVVRHRASGYAAEGDRFRVSMSRWQQTGDGAVLSSLSDLLAWDRNFYQPRVGGEGLVAALTTAGRLATGAPIEYGLGQFVQHYRGLRVQRHGGSWSGFRSELLRFPDEHTSAILLCNVADAQPETLAERVADVVLRERLREPAPRPEPPPVDTRGLLPFVGTFWNADRAAIVRVVNHDDGIAILSGGRPRPLQATGAGYRSAGDGPTYRFLDGTPKRIERSEEGSPSVMFTAAAPWTPDGRALAAYAGTFWSDELQTTWRLAVDGDTLTLQDVRQRPLPLAPALQHVFTARGMTIQFQQTGRSVDGFTVSVGRARHIGFVRTM